MGLKKLYPKEYSIWGMMKQRVLNPNNKSYKNYGGRGISISKEWKNSFKSFIEDMGARPSDKHQIDRLNNDGHYCAENCRWVTPSTNQLNKSLYKGVNPKCISKSGKKFRAQIAVHGRMYHIGNFDTLEEALFNRDTMYMEWYGTQPTKKRKERQST